MQMEKNDKKGGFVFQISFYDALEELKEDPNLKNEITIAIIDYGSTGTLDWDKLQPITRCVMKLITPIIDRQQESYRKKSEAGKSGGRPRKKAEENQNKSNEKAEENQNESNGKAEENQDKSKETIRFVKEKEKEYDIEYNKEINKEKEIVCFNAESENSANEKNTQKEIFNWFFDKTKNEASANAYTEKFIQFNKTEYGKDITQGESWINHVENWFEREKKKVTTNNNTPQVAPAPRSTPKQPLPGVYYTLEEIRRNKWDEAIFDPSTESTDVRGRKVYMKKSA